MTYDDVYRMIGSCGRYQKLIYVLQTLPVMFAAVQTYLSVFILYVPDHRCSSLNSINTTHAPQDIHFLSSRCKVYYNIKSEFLYEVYNSPESSNWDNLTMPSSECRSWEYDTALFENTFVTQKNLVCKKKLYRTHAIVAYMAGFTLGSLGMGIFSDKFGRKVVLMASIALYIGSSIPLSFVNEFSEFTVSRIFSGYENIAIDRFVVSLVFFGLSWNVSNLGNDVFLNFYLTSIAQIVGFLLCIPLLNGVGRKPVYVGSLFMGGVALLLTIFPVKYGSSDIEWITFSLSFVGMTGSSMAVATLFLYSTELFPTVVRNSGLGIANLCACIGGIIAPYIPDLNKIVNGDIGRILPMSIFGIFAIIAGLLSLLLPETNKPRLPETLGDAVLQNEGPTHRDMEMVTVIQPLKETPESSLTLQMKLQGVSGANLPICRHTHRTPNKETVSDDCFLGLFSNLGGIFLVTQKSLQARLPPLSQKA
uniref:Solute carrier family 22 member 15 n=1 Tax=Magallana gigas TaxID=29159 RepID=K1Q8B9_MAGGI